MNKVIEISKQKNYYGCMHELPYDDKRIPKFIKQLKERGFDDTETWNLDTTILKFVLPRLKQFRKLTFGTPYDRDGKSEDFLSLKQWRKKLNKMIKAMVLILEDKVIYTDKEKKQIDKGFDLFHKYFFDLWW